MSGKKESLDSSATVETQFQGGSSNVRRSSRVRKSVERAPSLRSEDFDSESSVSDFDDEDEDGDFDMGQREQKTHMTISSDDEDQLRGADDEPKRKKRRTSSESSPEESFSIDDIDMTEFEDMFGQGVFDEDEDESKSTSSSSSTKKRKPAKKRAPRKKKGDGSATADGSAPKRGRKRKVKANADGDGDGDGEDEKEDGSPKKKKKKKDANLRRSIKDLISDEKLSSRTKAAEIREKERLERLKNRPLVAKAADGTDTGTGTATNEAKSAALSSTASSSSATKPSSSSSSEAVRNVDKCFCLNPQRDPGAQAVYVDERLSKILRPHQVDALRFIFDNTIESVEYFKAHPEGGEGCIIAHLMGLGKTLLSIAYLHTLRANRVGKHTLAIVPVNVVHNWVQEIRKWFPAKDRPFVHVLDAKARTTPLRLEVLRRWKSEGGVCIIGYEMFRNLIHGSRVKDINTRVEIRDLLTETAELVFLDEGHRIKNEKSNLSKVLAQLKTKRRVVLTGTPLQNNLLEYYCMVDFVKSGILGTVREFKNRFETPIQNGQCRDSTARDVKLMKERTYVLHDKLKGFVHRRDYANMSHKMPRKHEYAVFVRLSSTQVRLYKQFLEYQTIHGQGGLFTGYHQLRKVWNHPDALVHFRDSLAKKRNANQKSIDSMLRGGSGGGGAPAASEESSESDESSGGGAGGGASKKRKGKSASSSSGSKGEDPKLHGLELIDLDAPDIPKAFQSKKFLQESRAEWWGDMLDARAGYRKGVIENSGKLVVTLKIVADSLRKGDKVIIFSQSLFVLDLLQATLSSQLGLKKNKHLLRIDGSTRGDVRQDYVNRFQASHRAAAAAAASASASSKANSSAAASAAAGAGVGGGGRATVEPVVFLVSTKAGCLGIDLSAANRVIVFDASWNPSHDIQAVCRAYRFGQRKDVFVYRLMAAGTMEQKIFERQLLKQGLSLRVVDEYQVERAFDHDQLDKLFALDEDEDASDMVAGEFGDGGRRRPVDREWLPYDQRRRREEKENANPFAKGLKFGGSGGGPPKANADEDVDEVDKKTNEAPPIVDDVLFGLVDDFGTAKARDETKFAPQAEAEARARRKATAESAAREATLGEVRRENGGGSRGGEANGGSASLPAPAVFNLPYFTNRHRWIRSIDQPELFLTHVDAEQMTAEERSEAQRNFELHCAGEYSGFPLPYGSQGSGARLPLTFPPNEGTLERIANINRRCIGQQMMHRRIYTQLICPTCKRTTRTSTPSDDTYRLISVQCDVCHRLFNVGPPIFVPENPNKSTICDCPFCHVKNTFPRPNQSVATVACGKCRRQFRVDTQNGRVVRNNPVGSKFPVDRNALPKDNPISPPYHLYEPYDYKPSSSSSTAKSKSKDDASPPTSTSTSTGSRDDPIATSPRAPSESIDLSGPPGRPTPAPSQSSRRPKAAAASNGGGSPAEKAATIDNIGKPSLMLGPSKSNATLSHVLAGAAFTHNIRGLHQGGRRRNGALGKMMGGSGGGAHSSAAGLPQSQGGRRRNGALGSMMGGGGTKGKLGLISLVDDDETPKRKKAPDNGVEVVALD